MIQASLISFSSITTFNHLTPANLKPQDYAMPSPVRLVRYTSGDHLALEAPGTSRQGTKLAATINKSNKGAHSTSFYHVSRILFIYYLR